MVYQLQCGSTELLFPGSSEIVDFSSSPHYSQMISRVSRGPPVKTGTSASFRGCRAVLSPVLNAKGSSKTNTARWDVVAAVVKPMVH